MGIEEDKKHLLKMVNLMGGKIEKLEKENERLKILLDDRANIFFVEVKKEFIKNTDCIFIGCVENGELITFSSMENENQLSLINKK